MEQFSAIALLVLLAVFLSITLMLCALERRKENNGHSLFFFLGYTYHSVATKIRRQQQQEQKDNVVPICLPRKRPIVQQHLLSRSDLERPEEVIDMRVLNFELAFDNPQGGAWKQGFDVTPINSQRLRIFVVPHSHSDPGWLKTFDRYFRQQTSAIITAVVEALLKDVRQKFIWTNISYFSGWWDEQNEVTRNKVRLLLHQFVTGGWVQPDKANSELYAKGIQLQVGQDWIRSNVGPDYIPEYGGSIDPFGYSPTAAYLWKKYNFSGMLIQRVHYAVKKELAKKRHLEFFWRQTWDDHIIKTEAIDEINGQHIQPHDIYTHVMPLSVTIFRTRADQIRPCVDNSILDASKGLVRPVLGKSRRSRLHPPMSRNALNCLLISIVKRLPCIDPMRCWHHWEMIFDIKNREKQKPSLPINSLRLTISMKTLLASKYNMGHCPNTFEPREKALRVQFQHLKAVFCLIQCRQGLLVRLLYESRF